MLKNEWWVYFIVKGQELNQYIPYSRLEVINLLCRAYAFAIERLLRCTNFDRIWNMERKRRWKSLTQYEWPNSAEFHKIQDQMTQITAIQIHL